MGIDDIKNEAESAKSKKDFYKSKLDAEKDHVIKGEIRKLYVEELKRDALVKLDSGETGEFRLIYDSIGEGLEPMYFWVLDFLRSDEPSGLGLEVAKTEENFEATVGSAFFGEMGNRRAVMEDRAMKMMQMVNTLVRSIINLLYDLKEFKQRLTYYEKAKSKDPNEKSDGEMALRGMWLDQVDQQKGRASINVLTQQLQFYTLRDAFFTAKSTDDLKNLDLNDRVKNILRRKLSEYFLWKDLSEKELSKRNSIELHYLKSQLDSLKLYTKWSRPYLRAAQQLKMKEFNSPDLIGTFDNMVMELKLFGKREVKPGSIYEEYSKIKLDDKYYACVEVNFKFRSIPQALRTQQGNQYVNSGNTEMTFKSYVFTAKELKEVEAQELYEDMDVVESLTNLSLKDLEKDIDEFLNPVKEEKKEEKKKAAKKYESPIWGAIKGFSDSAVSVNRGFMSFLNLESTGKYSYQIALIRKKAQETALKNTFVAYDVYKKTHGMMSW